jgi:hypothetical protein
LCSSLELRGYLTIVIEYEPSFFIPHDVFRSRTWDRDRPWFISDPN